MPSGRYFFASAGWRRKLSRRRPDHLHVAHIPNRQSRCEDLSQDSGHRRAHHSPFEAENENGVQHDINSGAGQRGRHGELGASVGTDDGVQRLAEHIKRYAQGDPEEILLGLDKGLVVDPAAKSGEKRLLKGQIDDGQEHAADDAQQCGAADAPVGVLLVPGSQADADIGAAAVADHHGNGQRHHRQREHDAVGGVAVRAEVIGVGNEDLIHDVVKRRHQQRDDAGDGVFPHQRPQFFLFQEHVGIGFVHLEWSSLSRQKNKAHGQKAGFTPLATHSVSRFFKTAKKKRAACNRIYAVRHTL